MKPLRFWAIFFASSLVGTLGFCRAAQAQQPASVVILGPIVGVSPRQAECWPTWSGTAPDVKSATPPMVKLGSPSQVLVRIGQPYIAVRRLEVWISRWDIRKPRH